MCLSRLEESVDIGNSITLSLCLSVEGICTSLRVPIRAFALIPLRCLSQFYMPFNYRFLLGLSFLVNLIAAISHMNLIIFERRKKNINFHGISLAYKELCSNGAH